MSERAVTLDALVGDDEWSRHRVLDQLRAGGASAGQLASFRAALASDDASARAAARMALAAAAADGSPSAPGARRVLVDALADADEDLRVLAASALGESDAPAAVPPLLAALEDGSPNVAAAAADALGQLGAPEAVEPLARLVATDELWLRAAAIVALGRLRDGRAIPALERAARSPGLEVPLVEALRRIGEPRALPVLEEIARTAPMEALVAAGAILCAEPEATVPEWVRSMAETHEEELRASLAGRDDPAVARLLGIAASAPALELLADLLQPPRRSEAALAGLLAAPAEARAATLMGRMEDQEPEDLAVLLSLLPPLHHREHIAALVPLLSHDHAGVRGAAAEALARAPAERALPLLTEGLGREGAGPEVIRALGGLGGTACAALVPLMTDPSPAVRTAAAEALARCADDSAVAAIQDALSRESWPDTRRALLRALGHAGGPLGPLALALDDPDPETRIAAIDALGDTGTSHAVPHLLRCLDRSEPEALAALRALGRAGNGGVAEALVPSLSSLDVDRRRTAAHAAVSVAGELAEDVVVRLAADADEWVRVEAARILAHRGEAGRARLESLSSTDRSPAVRAEARRRLDEED